MSPAGTSGACTLGLDLGTSSAKAVVLGADGTVLAQASAGYPVTSAAAGWAETDPALWWSAVVDCAREALAGAARAGAARAGTGRAGAGAPVAIGLSGQMHGLVLAGADGRALRPAMLWADSRAGRMLDRYRGLGREALERLANPLFPGMAGPMLAWVAACEPSVYGGARWALSPKDWLRARLTGEIAAEPSDASATLLYDVARDRWDLDVVSGLGLDAGMLAPLLPSGAAVAGRLRADAADELGLPAGVVVAAGAGDTAAAALGSGIGVGDDDGGRLGEVQLTVGTGAQVLRPVAVPVNRAEAGVHLFRLASPQGWYQMGATLSAGLSLTWVREVLNASWEELYDSASRAPAAGDPVFVPHLAGERTPYVDPGLRGSWTSLTLGSDRGALLRSALEGVAFAIRDALEALMGSEEPPGRLRLAGGGTLAPGWRQLLADVLGVPLDAVDVPAASGRGAALLGAIAAGLTGFDDCAGALAPPARLAAEPDPARAALYTERHGRFRQAVTALREGTS